MPRARTKRAAPDRRARTCKILRYLYRLNSSTPKITISRPTKLMGPKWSPMMSTAAHTARWEQHAPNVWEHVSVTKHTGSTGKAPSLCRPYIRYACKSRLPTRMQSPCPRTQNKRRTKTLHSPKACLPVTTSLQVPHGYVCDVTCTMREYMIADIV